MNQQPTILSSTLVFLAALLVMMVAINVALWAMVTFAGISTDSGGGLGFLPLILGAMFAGQRYGNLAKAKPPSGHAWLASFCFAVTTVAVLGLTWFVVVQFLNPGLVTGSFGQLVTEIGLGAVIGIAAGLFVLIWVLQRISFGFGAGQSIKIAQRVAAKTKG